MKTMENDPTISRIRQARHEVSERCGHDARKLVAYYQELQKRHADRLVPSKTDADKSDTPTASAE